ncbi:response regulator transcription factor [Chitiniphilus purpureus]|uniref:Response regulator transcription factor n=1 Tax=Chitiniphilus purpureus TaxID=2981137 RepID=A0ABY6DHQ3_9NEIS|nr:response regulator transcription factor [Chitiniphilus sp. CD1]UXY13758.1 response regulator transcription factor [Chitiniphilus sp. CD1]
MPARLLIADDHELTRAGLRALLEGEPDLAVIAEAGDGRQAVALCERLQPDLALLDVRMPGLDGLTAAGEIRRRWPGIRVVIVTLYESPDYLEAALAAGAAGYLLKDATRADVLGTVRRALNDEPFLNGNTALRLLRRMSTRGGQQIEPLTDREREVLALIVAGLSNREIGERLGIAAGTAKVHVERILGKLAVTDRTQAAVRALALGLVPTPESPP